MRVNMIYIPKCVYAYTDAFLSLLHSIIICLVRMSQRRDIVNHNDYPSSPASAHPSPKLHRHGYHRTNDTPPITRSPSVTAAKPPQIYHFQDSIILGLPKFLKLNYISFS